MAALFLDHADDFEEKIRKHLKDDPMRPMDIPEYAKAEDSLLVPLMMSTFLAEHWIVKVKDGKLEFDWVEG